jgi:hypothetical protein
MVVADQPEERIDPRSFRKSDFAGGSPDRFTNVAECIGDLSLTEKASHSFRDIRE